MVNEPKQSPWGKVQSSEDLFIGVFKVHTEGHGGIMIPYDYADKILSPAAQDCGFKENGYVCFEEDTQSAVVLREMLDKKQWRIPENITDKAAYETNLNNSIKMNNPEYWQAREQALAERETAKTPEELLFDRLDKNLTDYKKHVLSLDKESIFEMAEKITAMVKTHDYLKLKYGFDEPEVEYLLKFQNPLELLGDRIKEYNSGFSDFDYVVNDACDKQDALQVYTLYSEVETSAQAVQKEEYPQMSELKQRLLKLELANIGFHNAVYIPESGKMAIQQSDNRMPFIADNGDIFYGSEHFKLVTDKINPIVKMVNEITAAWEKASDLSVEGVSHFRVLLEHNNVILAARDDGDYGRGLHFVTWRYNQDHTSVESGNYTNDYNIAKEDFVLRSGLIPSEKFITQEQAADLKTAVDFYVSHNDNITFHGEECLKNLSEQLSTAYPEVRATQETHSAPEKAQSKSTKKPSLIGRLQDATKEVKPPTPGKSKAKEISD